MCTCITYKGYTKGCLGGLFYLTTQQWIIPLYNKTPEIFIYLSIYLLIYIFFLSVISPI